MHRKSSAREGGPLNSTHTRKSSHLWSTGRTFFHPVPAIVGTLSEYDSEGFSIGGLRLVGFQA
jgi:hypothetical protein